MQELICIMCPNGCLLKIDGEIVTGNKCKRGIEFALNEIKSPKRTLTTTVRTAFDYCPVLPVKLSSSIPKNKIFDCLREIDKIIVTTKVSRGDVILKNIAGLDVDLIATSNKLNN